MSGRNRYTHPVPTRRRAITPRRAKAKGPAYKQLTIGEMVASYTKSINLSSTVSPSPPIPPPAVPVRNTPKPPEIDSDDFYHSWTSKQKWEWFLTYHRPDVRDAKLSKKEKTEIAEEQFDLDCERAYEWRRIGNCIYAQLRLRKLLNPDSNLYDSNAVQRRRSIRLQKRAKEMQNMGSYKDAMTRMVDRPFWCKADFTKFGIPPDEGHWPELLVMQEKKERVLSDRYAEHGVTGHYEVFVPGIDEKREPLTVNEAEKVILSLFLCDESEGEEEEEEGFSTEADLFFL